MQVSNASDHTKKYNFTWWLQLGFKISFILNNWCICQSRPSTTDSLSIFHYNNTITCNNSQTDHWSDHHSNSHHTICPLNATALNTVSRFIPPLCHTLACLWVLSLTHVWILAAQKVFFWFLKLLHTLLCTYY